MKTLETEVMSLETAKLPEVQEFLKDRETKFVWVENKKGGDVYLAENCIDRIEAVLGYKPFTLNKTLTIGEMLDVLPVEINKKYNTYYLYLAKLDDMYCAIYNDLDNNKKLNESVANHPAKALEKLFVWCLKEGYLK